MKSFLLISLATVVTGLTVQNQVHMVKLHPSASKNQRGMTVMHRHCPMLTKTEAKGLIKEAQYTPPADPVPTGYLSPKQPNIGEGIGLECGEGAVYRSLGNDILVNGGYVSAILSSAAPAGDYMLVFDGVALNDCKVKVWSNDQEGEVSVKKGEFHVPITASRTATYFPMVRLSNATDTIMLSGVEVYPLHK